MNAVLVTVCVCGVHVVTGVVSRRVERVGHSIVEADHTRRIGVVATSIHTFIHKCVLHASA